MAVKAVIDTNVLLSGILFGGQPRTVLDLAREKHFEAVISVYILKEFKEVAVEKFKLPSKMVEELMLEIASFSEVFPVINTKSSWSSDLKDNPIIETALKSGSSHLVTGDERLKRVKTPSLIILNVREFLELLKTV